MDLCAGGGPCWTCVQGEVTVGLVCGGGGGGRSLFNLCGGRSLLDLCAGEEGGDPCLTCVGGRSLLDLCAGGRSLFDLCGGEVPVGLVCRGRLLLDLCAGGRSLFDLCVGEVPVGLMYKGRLLLACLFQSSASLEATADPLKEARDAERRRKAGERLRELNRKKKQEKVVPCVSM